MAFSSSACSAVLFCFISLSLCSGAPIGRFRGSQDKNSSHRTVASDTIKADLREIMEVSLKGGDSASARRLAVIEASMWKSFRALPKNHMGHLAPRAVRHIVHTYFAKHHGWIINGLAPHGMQENVTDVHEVTVFQDKAPALVEGLLQARHNDHGMSLRDVVLMAAVLERLIFDESIAMLRKSYFLNRLSATDGLTEPNLLEVLTTYLLYFQADGLIDHHDVAMHDDKKNHERGSGDYLPALEEFGQDAVSNFNFARRHSANLFTTPRYSFEDSALIVEDIADKYGVWQNSECTSMKEALMNLAPDGSGRIPLSRFYNQPSTSAYHYTESKEYLRSVGALDESFYWGEPRVLLANYLAGPSNCIATTTYFSVCCLSECEGLLNELEEDVKAPSATPERLLAFVADLSSSSVEAPRVLPVTLKERLTAIATRSENGEVFIHGRLFAQWLHYAFPNECAHPHTDQDTSALSPSHTQVYDADLEYRSRHIAEVEASTLPDIGADGSATIEQWSDEEVLPLLEPMSRRRSSMRSLMWSGTQLAMFTAVARMIFSKLSSLALACGCLRSAKGGELASMLPKYA